MLNAFPESALPMGITGRKVCWFCGEEDLKYWFHLLWQLLPLCLNCKKPDNSPLSFPSQLAGGESGCRFFQSRIWIICGLAESTPGRCKPPVKNSSGQEGKEGDTHHIDQLDESQSKGYLDLLGHVLDGSDQLVVAPEQVSHQPLLVPRAHPCNRQKVHFATEQKRLFPPCALETWRVGLTISTDSTDDGIGFATAAAHHQWPHMVPPWYRQLYSTVLAPYRGYQWFGPR